MTINEKLFTLLRSALRTTEQCKGIEMLSEEELEALYRLAKAHDVAHLLADALDKQGLLRDEGVSRIFRKQQLLSVYRCEQMRYAFNEICTVLEQKQIPYVPLKGSVLRQYYPEEWMRTSCDIDILVHSQDIDRAVKALVETCGYTTDNKMNYHDISLRSPMGIHLELHFSIKENMDNIDGLLEKVWDYAICDEDAGCRYSQTKEYFLFHHVAHMSYHFVHGGCGIKPFMDMFIIMSTMRYDDSLVRTYCKQCGIEEFYNHVLYVTDVWFGTKPHTVLSRNIESYVLSGGVYGTIENKVKVAQSKQGSKIKYALSRIFVPYDTLVLLYPILHKHKVLFPIMQVWRWIGLVFKGRIRRGVRELTVNQQISKAEVNSMRDFLQQIGL